MLLVMFLFEGNEERPLFRRLSLLAANEKNENTQPRKYKCEPVIRTNQGKGIYLKPNIAIDSARKDQSKIDRRRRVMPIYRKRVKSSLIMFIFTSKFWKCNIPMPPHVRWSFG